MTSSNYRDVIISQEDIDKFDAWFDEIEIYGMRSERAHADVTGESLSLENRNKHFRHWMLWAFTMGRNSK